MNSRRRDPIRPIGTILLLLTLSLACAREGRLLEPEAASPPQPARTDVARMCDEAFLPLKGVRPAMRLPEVERLLVRQYGRETAAAIVSALRPHRIVVREDAIFLYTAALCSKKNELPERCANACAESEDIGKAQ